MKKSLLKYTLIFNAFYKMAQKKIFASQILKIKTLYYNFIALCKEKIEIYNSKPQYEKKED